MVWILVWAGSFVATSMAVKNDWIGGSILVGAIVLNAAIGVGMIITYMRFLKELDELQQRIQLNALALGMGIGLVGCFTYSLMLLSGFVGGPDVQVVTMMMIGGYVAGLLISRVRYA
jgi:hypothetical protein